MYSPDKISARIADAEREFGTTLEYHSPAEVDDFEKHLIRQGMYRYDSHGSPESIDSTKITEFERDWIQNEQALCWADAGYYLTRYAFIKDEQNIIQRFQPRLPQRLIFEIIKDLEKRDSSIELIVLKARQLGVSTFIILLAAHRIMFSHGVNSVIGSADQTKTALMANMLFLLYDRTPVWLRPAATRRVESDRGMLVFGHTSSGVSFQHGAQTSGIARGTTPTIYLLSECASFTNPVEQIEAALFKAVHASPSVFGALESTGEGDVGWWPDTWRQAKRDWPRNRSRLCPIFLPWFCGIDMYPNPTWLRMRPVPSDWVPAPDTRAHVAKSELFVRSNPLLDKHLTLLQQERGIISSDPGSPGSRSPHWRMPREQQWWWEVEYEAAKSKGIVSTFLQEMAGDDEEALQHSVESVFGNEVLRVLDERRSADCEYYGLSGQSIESAHQPPTELIDYDAQRVPVRYRSLRGGPSGAGATYRWDLIPLRFPEHALPRPDSRDDINGILTVWHRPRPGVNYSVGVDTAEGKGQDATVISVWTCADARQPDVQCAEYASAYVNHVEAFAFVLAICAYYGQHMERGVTRWHEPYLSIEQVAATGDVCNVQLKKMGYTNFHRAIRYDGTNPQASKAGSGKSGWFTYGYSRPILLGNFVHAAKNGWAEINSPYLLDEMRHFEVHSTRAGKERLEHEEGYHDDRVFSAAMAIFCPHDLDSLSERSQNRLDEPDLLPAIDLGPYRGNVVSSRVSGDSSTLTLDDMVYMTERDLERYRG